VPLLSCPFCRELYSAAEGPRCPSCELPLAPLGALPPSPEALEEDPSLLTAPEDQPLPLLFAGRGRGLGLLFAAIVLLSFFAPWVELRRPEPVLLSGFDLARTNVPFLWGGAVGAFLLLPLLSSRRTLRALSGVRVIATTFALMTGLEVLLLMLRTPAEHRYFASGLAFTWGAWLSLLSSAVLSVVTARLGGSLTDLRDLPIAPVAHRLPGEAVH